MFHGTADVVYQSETAPVLSRIRTFGFSVYVYGGVCEVDRVLAVGCIGLQGLR